MGENPGLTRCPSHRVDTRDMASLPSCQDKDLTLPGWGVWGGDGVKDPFPKRKVGHHTPRWVDAGAPRGATLLIGWVGASGD
jgi:hypothetical protein